MTKITICEDHELVREGLIKIMRGYGYEVLDAVSTGESLISSIFQNKPDLILLDISLPGRSGLDTLKNIIAFHPDMNVIALSMYPESHYALRMLKSGAKAYLNKNCSSEVLEEAIKVVSKGEEYVSSSLAKILLNSINRKNTEFPHQNLSDREYEVFLALGEGISLSELGEKLNLSVKTVSTYKSRVLEKLNANSNSDIVKYIINNDLNSSQNLAELL